MGSLLILQYTNILRSLKLALVALSPVLLLITTQAWSQSAHPSVTVNHSVLTEYLKLYRGARLASRLNLSEPNRANIGQVATLQPRITGQNQNLFQGQTTQTIENVVETPLQAIEQITPPPAEVDFKEEIRSVIQNQPAIEPLSIPLPPSDEPTTAISIPSSDTSPIIIEDNNATEEPPIELASIPPTPEIAPAVPPLLTQDPLTVTEPVINYDGDVAIPVQLDNGGVRVFFSPKEWEISAQALPWLEELTTRLKDNPNEYIRIHAYSSPQGSNSKEKRLALARARTAREILIAKNIPKNRMIIHAVGIPDPTDQVEQSDRVDFIVKSR